MLLERLIIEGFLSYRKRQVVELSDIMSCLVLGQINNDPDLSNGAGKSSLFEAVLVNFFGKSSGRSDVLDSYINDKLNKMYLEVVFKIDGTRFRSIRTKTRSSSASHEIFIDSNNDSVDEAKWIKTDKTIEEILGLTARTYSSTIYLNERDSLKIISGTSSERKEILRELLDIEIYEKASKNSSKKFNEFEQKITINNDIVKDRKEQLKDEAVIKENFVINEKDLLQLKKNLKNANLEKKEKLENKTKIEIQISNQKNISDQIIKKDKEIVEVQKNLKNIEQSKANIEQEVKDQKEKFEFLTYKVEKLQKQKELLQKDIDVTAKKLEYLNEVDKSLKIVTDKVQKSEKEFVVLQKDLKVLEQTKQELEQEFNEQKEKFNVLKQKVEDQKTKKELFFKDLKENEKQLLELDKADEKLKLISIQIKDIEKQQKSFFQDKTKFSSSLEITKAEKKPIKDLLIKLENFKSICPITQLECESLNSENKQTIITEKNNELKLIEQKEKDINENIIVLEKQIKELEQENSVLELEEYKLNKLSKTRQTLNDTIVKTKLQLQTIENDANSLTDKQQIFDDYIKQTTTDLQDFSKNINILNVSINKILEEKTDLQLQEEKLLKQAKTRQTLNDSIVEIKLLLQTIENEKNNFKEKQIAFNEYLKQTELDLQDIVKSTKEYEKSIVILNEEKTKLESSLNKDLLINLSVVNKEILTIENDIEVINKQVETKIQEVGQIKNSLDRLEKVKREITEIEKNNEEYTKNKKTFQDLTSIFGKDGIQKAIMKEAVPLLEKYALDFLSIFNDGSEKLKVKFDLDPKKQDGELKKGGGLDILVIEDGKDPKDLQMYSGGETVRIVFSIVLALAKLLSLRAGKRHESLIIDEKIAKLDQKGIEQFGDVIREISKIYKQVFVITHIESLKDLISGNQLIVNKTEENGSEVYVL
jgi:exonuclease SbcC